MRVRFGFTFFLGLSNKRLADSSNARVQETEDKKALIVIIAATAQENQTENQVRK